MAATLCHDSGSWLCGSSSALCHSIMHACVVWCMACGVTSWPRRLGEVALVEAGPPVLWLLSRDHGWHSCACRGLCMADLDFNIAVQTASQEVRRNMASFKEVRNNMSEGLRFYMSLQEAIAVLAQQAGDYILTRRLQRWGTTPMCHAHEMPPIHGPLQPSASSMQNVTCNPCRALMG